MTNTVVVLTGDDNKIIVIIMNILEIIMCRTGHRIIFLDMNNPLNTKHRTSHIDENERRSFSAALSLC